MLDRLSQITDEGEFVSDIKDNKDRLSRMLLAFTPARIGITAVGPMLLHPTC